MYVGSLLDVRLDQLVSSPCWNGQIYFIDHEKSLYVDDAKLILASGTLQKGSLLAADNVIMPGAPEYIEFLQNHPQFTSTINKVTFSSGGVDAVMVSEFQG
jgi:predicted O-methyltransferase YrrM